MSGCNNCPSRIAGLPQRMRGEVQDPPLGGNKTTQHSVYIYSDMTLVQRSHRIRATPEILQHRI
jgi:hypothetical protein